MPTYPTRRATSAGGVVCDDRDDGQRWVLLIARRNAAGRAQWTLPKGRLEAGETAQQAAIREVREETGHTCAIAAPIGTIDYWFLWHEDAVRYHKYVHYWFMWWDRLPPGERDDEAEHVEWVPLEVALIRLAHHNERDLVASAAAHVQRDGGPSPWASLAPVGPVTSFQPLRLDPPPDDPDPDVPEGPDASDGPVLPDSSTVPIDRILPGVARAPHGH